MVKTEKQLRIYVCGRLAVEQGEMLIPDAAFPGRQGRLLWAYLVLHRRNPVSREELADALWGFDSPDSWDSTLSGLASRLRALLRSISGVSLEGERGRYALKLAPDAFIDYERARSAVHNSDRCMRLGDHALALAEARVAMEIAARTILPGEDAPWIEGYRRLMSDVRARALERTVEAELLRENPDLAEHEARLLVEFFPLRESGYRLLMRSLAAMGNRSEALSVMEECRRVLLTQADVSPSEDTERVFREIMGR